MENNDTDGALVARVCAVDDRQAFELLVRRHQSPLRAFLRRLTRNDAARADDLAQETFIKLYRSACSYRAQARFTTWLFRIAYNTFLNDERGRVDETPFEDAHHPATAPDAIESQHDFQVIADAVLYLSQRQRAAFDLHYQRGLTHTEVAIALGLPLGTVKSDLARGLEELRAMLLEPERS